MPTINDPQNPVHFALNSEIPTELDKTKVNYGLAQLISDGPSAQDEGVFIRGVPAVTVPTPVSPNPSAQLGTYTVATPPVNQPPPIYTQTGVQQLGKGP